MTRRSRTPIRPARLIRRLRAARSASACSPKPMPRARARGVRGRQQLATTEAEGHAALMRVFQCVGVTSFDPGTVPIYDAAVAHPDPAGAFDQARACSPKRKRLLAEADAARAQAKVAKASALPQLSAQMSYNQIIGTRAGLAEIGRAHV